VELCGRRVSKTSVAPAFPLGSQHNRALNIMEFMRDTHKFHCHIGVESVAGPRFDQVAEWVAKLLYQTAMHETALYASTGTHRRENGGYARSIKLQKQAADKVRRAPDTRKQEALQDVVYGLARYHTLNLTNLFTRKSTVEFRWAAGTVEWVKMVGHICTCLALAERATETTRMDWDALASERT